MPLNLYTNAMFSVDADGSPLNLLRERTEATHLLQWWHRWQMQMLRQEADYIRNDLLQEVFAIRRHLETTAHSPVETAVKLTNLYTSLEQLSDRLESPYGQEDLPLALRHTAEPWCRHLPITLDLPQAWGQEPAIQVRLLIAIINVLCLTLTSSEQRPQNCCFCLTQRSRGHSDRSEGLAQRKEMVVTISYSDLPPPALVETAADELTPLLKTFQLLTKGSYTIDTHAHARTWILRWPSHLESTFSH